MESLVLNCEQRNSTADPRLVVKLYDEFLQLQQEADSVRQARNENAAAMKVAGQPSWPLHLLLPASGSCA